MSRTATHGHHNLITSGHGDKLSRSSEAVARDGRLSRLLASRQRSIGDGICATSYRPVLFRISSNWNWNRYVRVLGTVRSPPPECEWIYLFFVACCCTHNNDRVKTARIATIRDYVGIEWITTSKTGLDILDRCVHVRERPDCNDHIRSLVRSCALAGGLIRSAKWTAANVTRARY